MNNSKAYNLARTQIQGAKYLYQHHVVGLISGLHINYGLPLTQQLIEDVKSAIIDQMYDGIDIEWEDYGMYQWWEHLNVNWFALTAIGVDLICGKIPSDFKENDND